MSEIKKEVRVMRVTQTCDSCLEDLVPEGHVYMTYPAQYPHKCPRCGMSYTFDKVYPTIEYEEIKNER